MIPDYFSWFKTASKTLYRGEQKILKRKSHSRKLEMKKAKRKKRSFIINSNPKASGPNQLEKEST